MSLDSISTRRLRSSEGGVFVVFDGVDTALAKRVTSAVASDAWWSSARDGVVGISQPFGVGGRAAVSVSVWPPVTARDVEQFSSVVQRYADGLGAPGLEMRVLPFDARLSDEFGVSARNRHGTRVIAVPDSWGRGGLQEVPAAWYSAILDALANDDMRFVAWHSDCSSAVLDGVGDVETLLCSPLGPHELGTMNLVAEGDAKVWTLSVHRHQLYLSVDSHTDPRAGDADMIELVNVFGALDGVGYVGIDSGPWVTTTLFPDGQPSTRQPHKAVHYLSLGTCALDTRWVQIVRRDRPIASHLRGKPLSRELAVFATSAVLDGAIPHVAVDDLAPHIWSSQEWWTYDSPHGWSDRASSERALRLIDAPGHTAIDVDGANLSAHPYGIVMTFDNVEWRLHPMPNAAGPKPPAAIWRTPTHLVMSPGDGRVVAIENGTEGRSDSNLWNLGFARSKRW